MTAPDFDPSIVEEFVTEAKEHLGSMEGDLLSLEKQLASPDPELVNRLFRIVHSVKGGAGFLGFSGLKGLAHEMETALGQVRDGKQSFDPEAFGVLFEASDLMRSMVDNVEHSDQVRIDEVSGRLARCLSPAASAQPEASLPSAPVMQPAPALADSADPRNFQPERLFHLHYNLSRSSLKPLGLLRDLSKEGTVLRGELKVLPRAGNSEPAELIYDLVYATWLEGDFLKAVAGGDAVEVTPMSQLKIQTQPLPAASSSPPAPVPSATAAPEPPSVAADPTRKAGADADTVRIQVRVVDKLMSLAGELVLLRNRFVRTVNGTDPVQRAISHGLDLVTTEIQESVMATRMQPIGRLFTRFSRLVRDLERGLGKQLSLETAGSEVELDKTIVDALADPLVHLIRNACDHGIETPDERRASGKSPAGQIRLRAFHEGGLINVTVEDDGRGVNPGVVRRKALEKGLRSEKELQQMGPRELTDLLFEPGFSTAAKISDVSGRGVGLDVVRTAVSTLGGSISVDSRPGQGCLFQLKLPLTLAIIPSVIVEADGMRFALPQVSVEELVRSYVGGGGQQVELAGDHEVYRLRGQLLPLVRLGAVLAEPDPDKFRRMGLVPAPSASSGAASVEFAVVRSGQGYFGLIVDRIVGTEEIVVKPMHALMKGLGCYSGATVMGDGRIALILDIQGVARYAAAGLRLAEAESALQPRAQEAEHKALLFQWGEHERFAVPLSALARIERFDASRIELIGGRRFVTLNDVPIRLLRLDALLGMSAPADPGQGFILIPARAGFPSGILASRIIDVVNARPRAGSALLHSAAIAGDAVVNGRLTLFLDPHRLIALQEPSADAASAGGPASAPLMPGAQDPVPALDRIA